MIAHTTTSTNQTALANAAKPFVEHYRTLKALANKHSGSVVAGEIRIRSPTGGVALFFSIDQFEALLQAYDDFDN